MGFVFNLVEYKKGFVECWFKISFSLEKKKYLNKKYCIK